MFVVIPFPFVFEDFFSFLKIEKPQVVVPAETKIKNRIMIYNHLPAEMWGARANGWPEGRHLILASNDPLVHWHLNWRGNQWNPITHFHFIPDNTTTTMQLLLLQCICMMYVYVCLYLLLFWPGWWGPLLTCRIVIPPGRLPEHSTAVEHDIKVVGL